MDIMEKVEELVEKIRADKSLKEKFDRDPAAVLESLVGIDLPNDQVNKLVDAIKVKMSAADVGNLLGGLFGKK